MMESAKEEVISGATSSPQKKTAAKTNSAKASPSSRTSTSSVTQQASAPARKFTRTNTYGEDTIRDLKKNITFLNDENLVLKAKLRRSEDENTRKEKCILQLRESTKNDSDKSAANSAMSQLKRKIQKLEQTLREKETVIRQLQSDVRIAAQNAAMSTLRKETPIKSPSHPKSFSSNSPTSRISQTSLQVENDRLKQQLRRALAIEDSHISQYSDLGTDELISFIVRLNQDIENLKKNRKNSQPVEEATLFELQSEVEKLHEEIRKLKVDRLAYFEDCESKSSEIKVLKQEIDKLNKELRNIRETVKKPPSPTVKPTRPEMLAAKLPKKQPFNIVTTLVERSSKAASLPTATSGTTSKVMHVSPSNQNTKKTETRRTITTVTKVSTSSPVKVKTTKITLNVAEKKGTKLTTKETKEKASVDISTKLAEQIKQQESESRAEEQTKEAIHPQEPTTEQKANEEMKREEPRFEEKAVEEIKPEEPLIEINTENAIEGSDSGSVETSVSEEHEVTEFRQNIAAKKIQRQWRKHYTEKQEDHPCVRDDAEGIVKEEDLERFKQNRAAKAIQRQWRNYHEKNAKDEDGEGEIHLTTTTESDVIHGKAEYNETESDESSDGDDGDNQHDQDDPDLEMPSIIPEGTKEQEPKEKQILEGKINGEQEHE